MKFPERTLEIDEEGYPLLSGLRADDEGFLIEIFTSMQRFDDRAASPIVAKTGNILVLINAFSTPLVAQKVENIDEEASDWVFLAGYSKRILHSKLRVDEFHRIHAPVGEAAIPASLSRRAQSDFLFAELAPNRIRSFYEDSVKVSQKEFWQEAYEASLQGWELHQANPVLIEKIQDFSQILNSHCHKASALSEMSLCVPGAGRGHDVEFLSKYVAKAVAVDFCDSALQEHRRLYSASKVDFVVEDVFEFFKSHGSSFDLYFEHTLFCAIDPLRRSEYLRLLHASLKEGGYYFGVFMLGVHPSGPPFRIDQWELRERLKPLFEIFDWHLSRASVEARLGCELWVVLRKKNT